MEKVVYVSGMISGGGKLSAIEQKKHVNSAIQDAVKIWGMGGVYVICPHINSPWSHLEDGDQVLNKLMKTSCPQKAHTRILNADLSFLRRVDSLFMMKGWKGSKGAVIEHDCAKKHGIPIFYTLLSLRKFLKQRSHTCKTCGRVRQHLTKFAGLKFCNDCLPMVRNAADTIANADQKLFLKVPRM